MAASSGKAGAGTLYGTLEVLILQILSTGEATHGLDIARQIHRRSDEALRVEEGALYPALHRLQGRGLIEGEWRVSDKRRRARFYQITDAGQEALDREVESWLNHTVAVSKVLGVGEG